MNTRANMNSVTLFCSEKEFFLLVTTYCCTKDCFLCKFWTFSSFLGLVTKKGALCVLAFNGAIISINFSLYLLLILSRFFSFGVA